jgi:hypothetical protein
MMAMVANEYARFATRRSCHDRKDRAIRLLRMTPLDGKEGMA